MEIPRSGETRSVHQPLLVFCLVFIITIAPIFFGSVYPWASMTLTASLFFLLVLNPQSLFEARRLPSLVRFSLWMILVFLLIQIGWTSLDRYKTFSEFMKWIAMIAGFLLIQRFEKRWIVFLLWIFMMLGVFESIYGMVQVISKNESVLWMSKNAHQGFVTGSYFNRNHLAGLLELCLGIHLGLLIGFVMNRKWLISIGLGFILGITLFGFVMTGSRMGNIVFLLSLAGLFFFLREGSWKKNVIYGGVLILGMSVLLWLGKENLFGRMEEVNASLQGWDGGRSLAWNNVFKMIADYPWFGVGLGNFGLVFPVYQSQELLMGWNHAHNDYLELLSELGFISFAFLFIILFGIWFECLKKLKDTERTYFPLAWGGMISLTAYGLHGFTDFNSALFGNALLAMITLGMVFRLVQRD